MKEKLIKILREENAEDSISYIEKKNPVVRDGLSIYCQQTGSDGDDSYWVVMSVTENDCETFWRVLGWASSESGTELYFNKIREVKPKDKVITVWEPK